MQYRNPVLPGTHPDPTVCRVGEDYYLATSSFEYFPGVPLYHSTDLVSWTHVGHCLTRESQLDVTDTDSSDGIYAPTLRHHDGTFYLVTTFVGGGGHFVVTAEEPTGEWSEPTSLDAPGFDPDLFFDDGTVYLSYAHGPTLAETTVHVAPVDLDTGAVGDSRTLWEGIEGTFCEAPHLYEVDGTYYLLTAEGGTHTNHMVVAARGDSPTGPFEPCPHNPILSHRGHPMHPVSAAGHGDLVDAPDGSWWLVFLGVRQQGGHPGWHHLGRETFLAPVDWRDGWPVVAAGGPVDLVVDVESLPGDGGSPEPSAPARETHETFDGETLDGAFEFRRNPAEGAYSLDDESLTLRPRTASLDDRGATFVGRRQAHFDCRCSVHLAFDPAPGEEAGLALVADERHHYEVGLRGRENGSVALVRRRVGDVTAVAAERRVDGETFELTVDATPTSYRFAVEAGGGGETARDGPLATAAPRYLATEVTGLFTGVYVGPYVVARTGSSDHEEPTAAHVERFRYEPTEP
ncbi:glycoside hydrolase family 43 protein [Halomarina oriensis]|uniref:Family 43 glycosylhydrolase n=1 Tax=Halomarina oriensis TaxID=671145 RepID=A0A6B0GI48_9EURY|nr:glycoside hydrolase family 43 protein [Halomarina oriensis]MWG33481.1 family 43 glycosylhydrolase [Halomarina oriensis]